MLAIGGEHRRTVNAALNVVSTLALVIIAIALVRDVDASAGRFRRVPSGRLACPFRHCARGGSAGRAHGAADEPARQRPLLSSRSHAGTGVGVLFHPLFQFLLMGVDGAFLTGDLFNLFVFFEVLLAASYGLALHGSGFARVTAGLHYIVVNLAASLLFLVGASLIYGVTGALNMADPAAKIRAVRPGTVFCWRWGPAYSASRSW